MPRSLELFGDGRVYEIKDNIAVKVTETNGQVKALIDALKFSVAKTYNIHPADEQPPDVAERRGSTLLKLLNDGNYPGTANQFPVWNKVNGQPWLGHTRRRLAERALFLGKPWQSFLTYEGTGEEVTGETIAEAPRTLKLTEPVMQGEDVRQVQEALQTAGINIEPDGFFGNDTDKAVKQFQKQKGLTADGIVGAETQKKLGL